MFTAKFLELALQNETLKWLYLVSPPSTICKSHNKLPKYFSMESKSHIMCLMVNIWNRDCTSEVLRQNRTCFSLLASCTKRIKNAFHQLKTAARIWTTYGEADYWYAQPLYKTISWVKACGSWHKKPPTNKKTSSQNRRQLLKKNMSKLLFKKPQRKPKQTKTSNPQTFPLLWWITHEIKKLYSYKF